MSKTNQEIIDFILKSVKEKYHGRDPDLNFLADALSKNVAEKVLELKDQQHKQEIEEFVKSVPVYFGREIRPAACWNPENEKIDRAVSDALEKAESEIKQWKQEKLNQLKP